MTTTGSAHSARLLAGVVLGAAVTLLVTGCGRSAAGADVMVLATTTSTQDSGLLEEILPGFEKASGCLPKTVAVGSGQAIEMGERGDADVLLVHSPASEMAFMAAGHGSSREPVMHNDFVVVGPPDDPAELAGADDAAGAMLRIADSGATFASRADDSGTHAMELRLWAAAGVEPGGAWYLETGQGMGPTLTIASQRQGYALTDRGTFLATGALDSEVLFEGSADLLNPYHVIVVDGDGTTNEACAAEFAAWIRSAPVQEEIADFGVNEHGQPLFFADAAAGAP